MTGDPIWHASIHPSGLKVAELNQWTSDPYAGGIVTDFDHLQAIDEPLNRSTNGFGADADAPVAKAESPEPPTAASMEGES